MLKVKTFVFSMFYENTYLIWDDDSKEAAVIDPGCLEVFEQEKLVSEINQNKLKIKYLINTHCHIDHIFGNQFIKSTYDCEYLAPEKDLPLIQNAENQGRIFGVEVKKSPAPDKFITESLVIHLGNIQPKFIYTPGHTPGEYSIYFENEKICFTGDVLFKEGIGRTDLWGGDTKTLLNSIKEKLYQLPDDTTIYPGHGELSTIGFEKQNNPFT